MLKHFKVNHVYQVNLKKHWPLFINLMQFILKNKFEFMSQHLLFANCVPLILKFFNLNITSFIQSKNKLVKKFFLFFVTFCSFNITHWSYLRCKHVTWEDNGARPTWAWCRLYIKKCVIGSTTTGLSAMSKRHRAGTFSRMSALSEPKLQDNRGLYAQQHKSQQHQQ